jgi:cyclopropane-fatty-acyl-phospholipid synthase
MTMVDVGGGWGSVLFEAYKTYGVLGTNISPTPDQNAEMQREIEKRGCEGNVKIKEIDFREDTDTYDRYISLGVYEHAGYNQLEAWIKAMADSLKPGGIGLLHFIGTIQRSLEETGVFIRKWVFPGGYLPGLAETIELMDKHGLEILDIENLRRHYNKTLLAWAYNFDRNWEKISALDPQTYDEKFRRQWRFYLYSCAAVFVTKHTKIGLFQIVFSKGRTKDYPMTREFLYEKSFEMFEMKGYEMAVEER